MIPVSGFRSPLRFLVAALGLMAAAHAAPASKMPNLTLPEPPQGLEKEMADALLQRKRELSETWEQLRREVAAFHGEFGNAIADNSARAPEARARFAGLQQRINATKAGEKSYAEGVKAAARLVEVDRQIEETLKQLGTNKQFKEATAEFERLHAEGKEAREQLIGRLLKRVEEMVTEKLTGALKDGMMERLKGLTPDNVRQLQAKLRAAGLARPELIAMLDRIAVNKTGPRVAEDAEKVLRWIDQEQALFDFSQTAKGDVAVRQEAALHLLTLLFDWPVLGEAKIVAQGLYDSMEANVVVFLLDAAEERLAQLTDQGLKALKKIGAQLPALFDQRRAVRRSVSHALAVRG